MYCIIATKSDALWVKLDTTLQGTGKNEIDLDEECNFGDIRCLQVFNNKFFVLANRQDNKLGTYALSVKFNLDECLNNNKPAFEYIFKSRHDL